MPHRSILVSTRHGEYMPRAVTVEHVWEPCSDDLLDRFDTDLTTPEATAAEFARRAGAGIDTLAEPYPGYKDEVDLTWENIVRLSGTDEEFTEAYTRLCDDLSITPHGDDDTFDYWPSGVLFARAIANACEFDDEPLRKAVVEAIGDVNDSYMAEVWDKIGIARPEPEGPTEFRLTIETGGAAFEGDELGREIARLLRKAADHIAEGIAAYGGEVGGNLMDVNGNTVGEWKLR